VTRRLAILSTAVLCTLSAACGGGGGDDEATTLTVFTDTALESPVTQLQEAFEQENPGVRLELEVAPTDELAERIRTGEEADIFIGERRDIDQMKAEETIEGDAMLLGTDLLMISVPDGNPANVTGLDAFLPGAAPRTAICAEDTDCGVSARVLFANSGIAAEPDRTDLNPIAILNELDRRTVDAVILWRTVASAASTEVDYVTIPVEHEMRRDFSVAGVEDNDTVERVVRWLATDPIAEDILIQRGFRAPVEDAPS
jgi:molybdate transport system substrate-binding protein